MTGQTPALEGFGPGEAALAVGLYADYPEPGQTTVVTFGAAQQQSSIWRGLPLGHELVLTVDGDPTELVELLQAAVLENRRRATIGDRRSNIEANGVWASGYPPHLLFTTQVSATPELLVQKKFGARYASFMAAIPLDDAELRSYDRSPSGLIAELREQGRMATYPRSPSNA